MLIYVFLYALLSTRCVVRAKLPFCAFIGVDQENKSRIIAQTLLPNETTQSFEFVIEHLVKLCGGLHPKVSLQGVSTVFSYVSDLISSA